MSNVITNSSTIQLKDQGGGVFGSTPVGEVTAVSRSGITWTFDQAETVGTFANGDPWVVGPVTIDSITPSDVAGRNGTMVNPLNSSNQGYDDRMQSLTFSGSLDVSDNLPLVVAAGSSVCSTISNATFSGSGPCLERIEVLTVLASAPADGSFRPPYIGTNKAIIANISDIDYSELGSVAQPNGGVNVPSLASVEAYFASPWYEHKFNWTGQYLHASANFPLGNYGREVSKASGAAVLSLQLDYTDAQKETLLIGVIQAGIDLYGAAKYESAVWNADGGHNQGRKMLVVLAAKVLGHTDMLTYADGAANLIFQEDQQTFVVTQETVNITNERVGTSLSGATFTTSTKTLTKTGEFSSYSFTSGDQIYITGGTGVTTGLYEIASRTDDDNLVLVSDIGGTNPSDVSSAGAWHWITYPAATHDPYEAGDIGVASWGIRHETDPNQDNAYYSATYETINSGPSMAHAAAAEIMGVTTEWNYSAFFDYQARIFPLEASSAGGTNAMSHFAHDMYDAYV